MRRAIVLFMLLAAAVSRAPAADAPPGLVTLLEGQAQVYRAAGRLVAQEGLRLQPGDIVETATATLLQIELADASVLQLGGGTRLMLGGAAKGKPAERWLYLMNGWLKVIGARKAAGPAWELRSPLFAADTSPATYVVRATDAELLLFVERERARITERPLAGPPVVVTLQAGEHYRRAAGARGVVNPGAMQAMLAEMPRAYRDPPPLRGERFKDIEVQPKPAPDFAYADVQDWLNAEPWLRRQFIARWRPKARDAAFRASLVAEMSAHPEWDRVLFPEKYRPKPPSPPSPVVAPAQTVGDAAPAR